MLPGRRLYACTFGGVTTTSTYAADGLGSVVGEVAPDGSLTCTRKLDVYGCVRSSSGTATSKHKFVGSLGHPSDDETGLIYMRARHYDPVCGRFISEDPARNRSNWLTYCGNDPVNRADGDGRISAAFLDCLKQLWEEVDAVGGARLFRGGGFAAIAITAMGAIAKNNGNTLTGDVLAIGGGILEVTTAAVFLMGAFSAGAVVAIILAVVALAMAMAILVTSELDLKDDVDDPTQHW